MDLALAGRPAWPEVAGVLVACAVVLLLLARMDHAASRDEADRARKALAERAEATPNPSARAEIRRIGVAGRVVLPVGASSAPHLNPAEATSDDGPPSTLLALFAGIGVIMALAGSALLARPSR